MEKVGIFYPITVTAGVGGISEKNPMSFVGGSHGMWAYENVREDVVYATVKALHLGYDTLSKVQADMKGWTLETALDISKLPSAGIPYHTGAIKYFKEINKWTPALEKWQQDQLAIMKKRLGR